MSLFVYNQMVSRSGYKIQSWLWFDKTRPKLPAKLSRSRGKESPWKVWYRLCKYSCVPLRTKPIYICIRYFHCVYHGRILYMYITVLYYLKLQIQCTIDYSDEWFVIDRKIQIDQICTFIIYTQLHMGRIFSSLLFSPQNSVDVGTWICLQIPVLFGCNLQFRSQTKC